jgi:hypothetical protein
LLVLAINIHFLNISRPASPLSERIVPFVASLIRLLDDAQTQHPDITQVRSGSWLNSHPGFYTLFPDSWKRTEVPRYPLMSSSNGIWGQFMDRRGGFHTSNGSRFRETGEVPYPNTSCHSPIEEVLDFLKSTYPKAVHHNQVRSADDP